MNLFRRLLQFTFSFHIRSLFLLMVAAIVIIPDVFIFASIYNDVQGLPGDPVVSILGKMILIALVAIIVISIIVWFACKIIFLTPMAKFIRVLNAVSRRDLSHTLDSSVSTNSEFATMRESINQMINALNRVIKSIDERSGTVAASSQELTASSEENKATIDEMAASLQEVATAADQTRHRITLAKKETDGINMSVASITMDTMKLTEGSKDSVQAVKTSQEEMLLATKQMQGIKQTVSELSKLVSSLGGQSRDMNQIIKVINDIADQTQMLSLNAAIEAARAGEHGKGFSVVANEIGKLADQSSASAKQVQEILNAVQHETGQVVQSMEKGVTKVDQGMETVNHTSQSFKMIENYVTAVNQNMKKVDEEVNNISVAVFKAASSYDTIQSTATQTSSNTQSLSSSIEEQASVAEEVAKSAGSLSEIADGLHQIAASFKVKVLKED